MRVSIFRSARSLATAILALLLVWGPLPFGSVRPRDRLLLLVGSALALAVAASSRRARSLRAIRLALAAWVGLVLWALVQRLPLPLPWIELLSPSLAGLRREAVELLATATSSAPISLAPDRTEAVALWIGALLAAFVASFLVGRRTRYRRALALATVVAALFEILYGARRWAARDPMIWGATVPGGSGRLRGTFVNPDHLALLLEIGICVTGAWIWWAMTRDHRTSLESRIARIGPPFLLWATLFAALAFTGSRAGLVAAVAGTLAQGVLLAVRRRRSSLALTGVGLVLLGMGWVAWLGLEAGFGRWLATSRYEIGTNVRRTVYGATLELWRQAPWTGTGLGSFRSVFPLIQPETVTGQWSHAHNDWLELLATGGVVGFLLLLVGLGALAFRLNRVWRRGVRSEGRAAGLAALGALTAVALHELLDFGLTIPANALTLAILVGAAAGTRLREPSPPGTAAGPDRSEPPAP